MLNAHDPSALSRKWFEPAPIGASGPCTIYRRISRFFRPEIPSAQARTGIARLWFQSRLLTRKKLGSIPKCNRMTHRPHSVKVEAQVVNRVQNLSQYFVRCIEMPKISSRVPGTNTAAAVRIEWASVSSVACLLDRNFSFRRKQQTMPRRPSGQDTIHHVDTKIGILDNLFRCTHAHKIAAALGGEMLNGGFDNLTCKFAWLTDTKSANCVSGNSDLDCLLGRFFSQPEVHPALHDSKESLGMIRMRRGSRPRLSRRARRGFSRALGHPVPRGGGSPRPPSRAKLGFRSAGVSPAMRAWTAGGSCPYVASAPRHFVFVLFKIFFAPFRPAQRQLHRRAHAARLRRLFRTFIKRHDDVRAKSDLGFGRGFRAEELCRAVQMGTECHAFLGQFAQLAQAEDLKSAGVSENRPIP